jgi:hypothetical protein
MEDATRVPGFGPVREIGGDRYRVRRAWTHEGKSRWELTRLTEGAAILDGWLLLDADATPADAERRLLGDWTTL